MTKVMAWSDGQGKYEITAKGHATGSVAGCAYISGILYSLAGYLTATGAGRLEECRMEPGDVVLRFRGGAKAEAAFWMAVIGLELLEESYPDIVRVEVKGGPPRFGAADAEWNPATEGSGASGPTQWPRKNKKRDRGKPMV